MTRWLVDLPGDSIAPQWLRTGISVALVTYALYLSAAAYAGQSNPWLPYGISHKAAALSGRMFDPNNAQVFGKPTSADPRAEVTCLALNIYFEARGEPETGKRAVGHVVMNRVASGRFPETVCDVVRQGGEFRRHRCQFSWWCDGRSDTPQNQREWQRSGELALAIYWGRSEDPTDGALWYHADYVTPNWRDDFTRGPKIGRHIFYTAGSARSARTQLATRALDQ